MSKMLVQSATCLPICSDIPVDSSVADQNPLSFQKTSNLLRAPSICLWVSLILSSIFSISSGNVRLGLQLAEVLRLTAFACASVATDLPWVLFLFVSL